ncbi:MAG: HD domain-containing protein, partial [Actinobacteria bacterium]|nr:HD domain-containing protein [Actinomycetota bacterium]
LSPTDEEFDRVSQFPVDEMWSRIVSAIVGMQNAQIRDIASDIMFGQGLEEAFKKAPAASSMHHAFQAGLLEHTSQMVEIAHKLFELPFIRNALNKDLCVFGILFHDFGKIFEYEHTGGFKHTIQGRLVPHIPMTAAIIFETANKLAVSEIVRDHLMHVVLAHHGKVEHGSPVDMAVPEAAFVHYVDNLHGDVYGWIQKMEETKNETVKHGSRHIITKRFDAILTELSVEDKTQGE